MDKYFLAIVVLIIFSVLFVLYMRISIRIPPDSDPKVSDSQSDFKAEDFTLLK
jgi:hypothetical protein